MVSPAGFVCERLFVLCEGDYDSGLKLSDCVDFFCPHQVRRGQRTVQTETKYIELMVVNDHELVGVKLTRSLLLPYLLNSFMKGPVCEI